MKLYTRLDVQLDRVWAAVMIQGFLEVLLFTEMHSTNTFQLYNPPPSSLPCHLIHHLFISSSCYLNGALGLDDREEFCMFPGILKPEVRQGQVGLGMILPIPLRQSPSFIRFMRLVQ